jgi:hypothetical protein
MSRWLVVMTLLAGCGFGLDGPDPQRPRAQMPKCDTGKGAVVVDGLMATVATVVALSLVANDEPAGALIPAGIGAAYIGGAVHGSRAVDECRKSMDEWSEMMAAREQLREQGPPGDHDEEDPRPRAKPIQPFVAPPPPAPAEMADVPPSEYEQPSEEAPPVASPPPVKQPPGKQPPVKQPPPKKPPPTNDDEWIDFWREVQ